MSHASSAEGAASRSRSSFIASRPPAKLSEASSRSHSIVCSHACGRGTQELSFLDEIERPWGEPLTTQGWRGGGFEPRCARLAVLVGLEAQSEPQQALLVDRFLLAVLAVRLRRELRREGFERPAFRTGRRDWWWAHWSERSTEGSGLESHPPHVKFVFLEAEPALEPQHAVAQVWRGLGRVVAEDGSGHVAQSDEAATRVAVGRCGGAASGGAHESQRLNQKEGARLRGLLCVAGGQRRAHARGLAVRWGRRTAMGCARWAAWWAVRDERRGELCVVGGAQLCFCSVKPCEAAAKATCSEM